MNACEYTCMIFFVNKYFHLRFKLPLGITHLIVKKKNKIENYQRNKIVIKYVKVSKYYTLYYHNTTFKAIFNIQ